MSLTGHIRSKQHAQSNGRRKWCRANGECGEVTLAAERCWLLNIRGYVGIVEIRQQVQQLRSSVRREPAVVNGAEDGVFN